MKLNLIHLLLAIFLSQTCVSQSLPAGKLYPYGRSLVNDSGHVELIGSGVHFGFSFKGRQCMLYAYITNTTSHDYLQYELDGVYQKRLKVAGGSRQPLIITAPTDKVHTVRIYKATEALTGPIFITKVEGKELKPLTPSKTPLIEFIGNSITCGAAADPSEIPCGTGIYLDQHNAYYAYGPRVARALGTNFMLSSVSGIGMYRNWNNDGPTMPQVYEKADLRQESNRPWDFSRYHPRIVSISLGTNDYSNGDGIHQRLPFDSALFVSCYIRFVRLIRSKYPTTRIALLSSPTISGSRQIQLENCLKAVKAGIDRLYPAAKPVALYFFKPMQVRGCAGHPNVEDHRLMAEELTPFFKLLL